MAKFKKALVKVAVQAYAYRLLVAVVYVLLAFAVRVTNLEAGIATQFDVGGMKPQTTRLILWGAFTLGAMIVMVVRRWQGDLLIMLPMAALVYYSIRYSMATQNMTAPTVYIVIFILVGFILWARRFYESTN